jgi:hypothetical protein
MLSQIEQMYTASTAVDIFAAMIKSMLKKLESTKVKHIGSPIAD